ncbi:hypothetical protein [Chamaesiphon sp. OTE_20_metabat_361]|uniref:hypothetical protein n=1 Tax=Chamaesiphon sp. OTE_20_metabat_361 TaxID=2964689 RepID=UPI00286CA44E|nr:hypothetical protein [Chamaesiphon sp. OTE_20_metabat_361]
MASIVTNQELAVAFDWEHALSYDKSIITAGRFDAPVLFFQNLLMHAWYAKRGSIN